MGQYLAIGIVTKCGISKSELKKNKITKNKLIDEMKRKLHFEPSIYDFSETDDSYLFKLNSNVFETQLVPFLEKLYPLIYLNKDSDFPDVIIKLKNTEPSEWLNLSKGKGEYLYEFQFDKYGENEYFYFDKPLNLRASIYSEIISLSTEGKIIMEVYGKHFLFFKYCIQAAFPEFSLAKALRVYITG